MSGPSLKSLLPVLAKDLELTPAALYERQRALVRAGLLHVEAGRGPGSGIRATPKSVALLITAILATANLSETEAQAKIVANLKSDEKRCPLAGKATFASALTAALASEDTARRIMYLAVDRGGGRSSAYIFFRPLGSEPLFEFPVLGGPPAVSRQGPELVSGFGTKGVSTPAPIWQKTSLSLNFGLLANSLNKWNK